MASINTNSSAIGALSVLRQTNDDLEASQKRISTGLRISESRDNASSFSIAQGLRSDIQTSNTIRDSIGLGESTLGVAVAAVESIDGLIANIRSRIVQSQGENVNRQAIQDEINQFVQQIDSQVQSANFNGANLLIDDGNPFNVLVGLSNGPNDTLQLNKQDLAVGTTAFDNRIVAGTLTGFNGSTTPNVRATSPVSFQLDTAFTATAGDAATSDIGEFRITVRDTAAGVPTDQVITISAADLVAAADGGTPPDLNGNTAPATDDASLATRLQGIVRAATGSTTFEVAEDSAGNFSFGESGAGTLSIETLEIDFNGGAGSLADLNNIDVVTSDTSRSDAITNIEALADTVRQANAALGSFQNRLDLQNDFVNSLLDSLDLGLSALVDADLPEESVEFNQLQTRQQLGFQALSNASQGSQALLSLFQN